MDSKIELKKLVNVIDYLSDAEIGKFLLDIIYDMYKEKTLKLFLSIQEHERDNMKEELLKQHKGLESAMFSSSAMGSLLLEEKTSRKAKDYAKFSFEGDNIAYNINVVKAYFPKGNADMASESGRWFFNKFKEQLLKHKEKYIKGGDSEEWAKHMGHMDYINLIIKQI